MACIPVVCAAMHWATSLGTKRQRVETGCSLLTLLNSTTHDLLSLSLLQGPCGMHGWLLWACQAAAEAISKQWVLQTATQVEPSTPTFSRLYSSCLALSTAGCLGLLLSLLLAMIQQWGQEFLNYTRLHLIGCGCEQREGVLAVSVGYYWCRGSDGDCAYFRSQIRSAEQCKSNIRSALLWEVVTPIQGPAGYCQAHTPHKKVGAALIP